jgi:hypothetical protein
MERFCKVGQPMRLMANKHSSPPLGTTSAFAPVRPHSQKVEKPHDHGILLNAAVRACPLPFE